MKNLIGQSILNYHLHHDDTPVITLVDGKPDAELNPSLFFRPYRKINSLERLALKMSKGKILDIGAGAGCHSILLQKRGMDVTALEISKDACQVMEERGIKNIICDDLYNHHEKYDTVLLLMNGFGLARNKQEFPRFLKHIKSLLRAGGQIIGDSTDIYYHFKKSDNLEKNYFGEVSFDLKYKAQHESFQWIYPDEQLIAEVADQLEMKCEVSERNNQDAFLVKLIV